MARFSIRVLQAFDKTATIQILDENNDPLIGKYTGTEPLGAKVWSGDSTPVVFLPEVAWSNTINGAYNALIDLTFPGADTENIQPATYELVVWRSDTNEALAIGDLVIDSTPGDGVFDLVGIQTVRAFLSDMVLTDDQIEYIPTAVLVAQEVVRGYCNRYFTRRTTTAEYTPTQQGTFLLPEMPVNGISAVRTSPATAIQVTRARATAQRAYASFAHSGSREMGNYATTGLTLGSLANAVSSTDTILFGAATTIQAVADAVNGLDDGWSATVSDGMGAWPSTELFGDTSQGCLGQPAVFRVYSEDASGYSIDWQTGLVYGLNASVRAGWGYAWPYWSDYQPNCGVGRVLVTADLGFDTVPYPVQQACAEMVKQAIQRRAQDQTIQSERVGDYSYTINALTEDMTDDTKAKLDLYRITHA